MSIPAPPSAGPGAVGAPDGTVFNPTTGFVVSNGTSSGPAKFLFATEDGTIVGWNPSVDPTHAAIAVDNSTATDNAGDVGAVYKGLALITTSTGTNIYTTNFRFGMVEEYNSNFQLVNSFTDPTIPAGFGPFGVHNVGGNLFVTYAKQGPGKLDDAAGPGNGFVDEFSPSGVLLPEWPARDGSTRLGRWPRLRPRSAPSPATSWSATSETAGSTPSTPRPANSSASCVTTAARLPSPDCGASAFPPGH